MIKVGSKETVFLDGSHGEGGGQILRTALSLSSVTGRTVEIENIRKSRRKPGLQPQHLMSVLAAARICGASLEGAKISSLALQFEPGTVRAGDYRFDISSIASSAGSTSLVFQSVLLPLLFTDGPSTVSVQGGTHVPWSPGYHYLRHVFLPLLSRMSARVQLELRQWGWYPKGGGVIFAGIEPCRRLMPLAITERGALKRVQGISAISNLPDHITERQRSRAIRNLKERGIQADIGIEHGPSRGRGTTLFLVSEFENIIAGFGSLGALGKKAETVADEACAELLEYLDAKGCLDPHLADQVVPYLALANGPSEITTSKVTPHLLTNIWVVQQFLETGISVQGREGEPGTIRVNGSPDASGRSSTV
jgi:RNA 3'-terminal phosphate cyclase (ATP)